MLSPLPSPFLPLFLLLSLPLTFFIPSFLSSSSQTPRPPLKLKTCGLRGSDPLANRETALSSCSVNAQAFLCIVSHCCRVRTTVNEFPSLAQTVASVSVCASSYRWSPTRLESFSKSKSMPYSRSCQIPSSVTAECLLNIVGNTIQVSFLGCIRLPSL